MWFENIHDKLVDQLGNELPGEDAQFEMAPMARLRIKEALNKTVKPKLSAVLILIYPQDGRATTVLMRRNSYKGVHSAQVSFPGGKLEESDKDLEATALREANEEVGIVSNDVEILGPLTELFIPPSGFLVQPYLGISKSRPFFIEDPLEVKQIIELPLGLLLEDSIVIESEVQKSGGDDTWKVPAFEFYGHTVWGATAMMLSEFKTLLKQIDL